MINFLGEIKENGVLELFANLTVEHFKKAKFKDFKFEGEELVLDASKLKNCDSCGIAAIICLIQNAKKQNKQVFLENLPFFALRLIYLYGLNSPEVFSGRKN